MYWKKTIGILFQLWRTRGGTLQTVYAPYLLGCTAQVLIPPKILIIVSTLLSYSSDDMMQDGAPCYAPRSNMYVWRAASIGGQPHSQPPSPLHYVSTLTDVPISSRRRHLICLATKQTFNPLQHLSPYWQTERPLQTWENETKHFFLKPIWFCILLKTNSTLGQWRVLPNICNI